MENFDIGITLTKLQGAQIVQSRTGRDAICIYIDECPELVEKNGAVYLDIAAIVTQNASFGTHCLVGKRKADGTRSEIIGNMRPWKKPGQNDHTFINSAAKYAEQHQVTNNGQTAQQPAQPKGFTLADDEDDLPF